MYVMSYLVAADNVPFAINVSVVADGVLVITGSGTPLESRTI